MSEKIEPALTAEEWANVRNVAPWNYDDAVAVEPKECAYLIALNPRIFHEGP